MASSFIVLHSCWHYRPLTNHDREWSLLAVAGGSAFTTAGAWALDRFDANKNWITIALGTLCFVAGVAWAVLYLRYSGHAWAADSMIITNTSLSFSAGIGLAILIVGTGSLLPLAVGMWASFVTVMVYVVANSYGLLRSSSLELRSSLEQQPVPDYAVGTPHDRLV